MIDAAAFPVPPYWLAVFVSKRRGGDSDDGYAETAARMMALAQTSSGFLGVESARRDDGVGITVAFWKTEAELRAWKQVAEHREAQRQGRADWYETYAVWVAQVERAYTEVTSPLDGLV